MSENSIDQQILTRLRGVLHGRIPVDPDKLALDSRLSDVGVDSFSLVELLFVAEEEFNIKIPFDGLNVDTVRDVVNLISRHGVLAGPA